MTTPTTQPEDDLVVRLRGALRLLAADEPLASGDVAEGLAEIHRQASEIARLRDALRWCADFACKLRNGTDDWFDLIEIEEVARAALKEQP